jgi:hypothetical protein
MFNISLIIPRFLWILLSLCDSPYAKQKAPGLVINTKITLKLSIPRTTLNLKNEVASEDWPLLSDLLLSLIHGIALRASNVMPFDAHDIATPSQTLKGRAKTF